MAETTTQVDAAHGSPEPVGAPPPAGVRHAMGRPGMVPVARYIDPVFADLERDRLWTHTWQMACRLEEIPTRGDYVEYVICDQSLLVVRVDASTVRAYSNACRHRATELAKGSGSFADGIIACPFHGWRWDLDGQNSYVFGGHAFDPALVTPEETCLRQARVDIWGGCVWINLDPAAPPLLGALDPMPGLLDPLGLADMRVRWWKQVILPANWKMAQEAFMEGYHVPQTHPQLTLGHPERYNLDGLAYSVYRHGHSSFQLRPECPGRQGKRGRGRRDRRHHRVCPAARRRAEAMTLDRDVHVIEGMRSGPFRRGDLRRRAGEVRLRVRGRARGSRCPRRIPTPWPVGAGSSSTSRTTSSSPSSGTPCCIGPVPYGDDPESCLFDVWSVSIPSRGHRVDPPGHPRGPLRPGRHRPLAAHPAPGFLQHRSPTAWDPHLRLRPVRALARLRRRHRDHAP